jgi:hypothetical protein
MSPVIVVRCQAGISATDRSLILNFYECVVSECDLETLTRVWPRPTKDVES